MDFRDFTDYCKKKIAKHPEHKEEIFDFFELCFDEIEDEGSEAHEIELAIESIEQAIKK